MAEKLPILHGPETYADMARFVVLGRTILNLTHRAHIGHFSEDVAQSYECYVKPGKTHFFNGEEITDQIKTNLYAGVIVLKLESLLTLNGYWQTKPTQQPSILQDKANYWAKPTADVLKKVGLYATANRPSNELRAVAPALKEFSLAARYYDLEKPKIRQANSLLPGADEFQKPYRRMQRIAMKFVTNIPEIDVEVIKFDDFMKSVSDFDPSTTAPLDISDSSWALTDIARDVPVKTEKFGFYEFPEESRAAEYLTSLLFDIEKLSDELKN
jgi:hypothetical protein